MKEHIEWALTQESVYRFTLPEDGKEYVSQDAIIDTLFASGRVTQNYYQVIIDYFRDHRADHSLGKMFEFFPPVVPFAQKGKYYMVMTFPTQEEINDLVRDLSERREFTERTGSYVPIEFVPAWDVLYAVTKELHSETPHYVDEAFRDFYEKAIPPAMEALGWTANHELTQFEKPLPIDRERTTKMDEFLDGAHRMSFLKFYPIVSADAYGDIYRMEVADWTAEFVQYAFQRAEEYGYVVNEVTQNIEPKPMELPDNIEEIGHEICTNPDLVITSDLAWDNLPIRTIRHELLTKHNISITPAQIENNLLGRQGLWRIPLVMQNWRLVTSTVYKSSFGDNLPFDEYSFDVIQRATGKQKIDIDKVDFAMGFPVTVQGLAVDNTMGQLGYLNVVGSYNSVQANWAALVQDKVNSFAGSNFKVGNGKNHRKFSTTLPSGLTQMIMMHHKASPRTVDSSSDYCYIVAEEGDKMPKHFIGTLDKMLTVPVLPQWAEYLWVAGRISGVIDYAGTANKQIGCTTWKIKNMKGGDSWKEIISTALNAGVISISCS